MIEINTYTLRVRDSIAYNALYRAYRELNEIDETATLERSNELYILRTIFERAPVFEAIRSYL